MQSQSLKSILSKQPEAKSADGRDDRAVQQSGDCKPYVIAIVRSRRRKSSLAKSWVMTSQIREGFFVN
ncbi:hypothetical protein FGO68_gene9536 [Halteria grandinella]|uniref:Uncharacterized protein n=1 Tax=Halteria grandinella TaxID=5974 RepID=A0A8J8STW2_HALGN|nr:hypothetical protein FGO68_gene9536 [Halteria grandinella]